MSRTAGPYDDVHPSPARRYVAAVRPTKAAIRIGHVPTVTVGEYYCVVVRKK